MHGFFGDLTGVHLRAFAQSTSSREGIVAARANRNHSVIGLDDIARSGEQKALFAIRYQKQSFESAQNAVGAPVFGELNGGSGEIAGIVFELGLKALQQGKSIGCGPCKADEYFIVMHFAQLAGAVLDDRIIHGDLSVGSHYDVVVAAHQQDGG